MARTRYVALLRGINVGGNNKISMNDLRAHFETLGFADVRTYINSGNVLFTTDEPRAELEDRIEKELERSFDVPIVVVVRSRRELHSVIEHAPKGFGQSPHTYHSDVVFLKSPLTSAKAMKIVSLRDGVDQAWPGRGVIYFARVSARRTQSKMSRITQFPEYKLMTIRSWSTTTKLATLIDEG